ncbi:rsmH, partial [Symbiodinium necroappetens]
MWAVPQPWGEAVDILIAAARAFPEPLPAEDNGRRFSSHSLAAQLEPGAAGSPPASVSAPPDLESPARSMLAPVVMDAPGLPVPAPDHVSDETEEEELVDGAVLVMAPQFQAAEILHLALSFPLAMDAFLNQAREALTALRLRFSTVVVPVFPQLGPDYATVLILPSWLTAAGMQVVVYDFRPLSGPVYSAYSWDRITYGDCVREARRHNVLDWQVFVNGHTRPLEHDESFLAVPGGVLQFRPAGSQAVWFSPLQARFDRPNMWGSDPELPVPGNELPIIVLYHEQSVLYSARRFPGVPTVACITGLVERTPDTALLVAPRGNALADVDHFGVRCRDALAVYPLAPLSDRESIIVFLDARQTSQFILHILLPSHDVEPIVLIRYLGLSAPPGCRVVHWPRADAQGMLRLSEGDTVTFGFAQIVPWDHDDEGDSDQGDDHPSDDGEESSSSPDQDESEGPTEGPDIARPAPVQSQQRNSSRSRSPRNHTCQPAALVLMTCQTILQPLLIQVFSAPLQAGYTEGLPFIMLSGEMLVVVGDRLALHQPVPAPLDPPTHGPLRVSVLIFVPDYKTEQVVVTVMLPISSDAFLRIVQQLVTRSTHIGSRSWSEVAPDGTIQCRAGQCLYITRSPRWWTEAAPFREPDPDMCYCCVHDLGYQLYASGPSRPWNHRADIAAAVEVPLNSLVITPAVPRVSDCTVIGLTCRTVLAAGHGAPGAIFVIVDCRPLLQGWYRHYSGPQLDLAALLADLGEFTPLGWTVALFCSDGSPAGPLVVSGQVLTAAYVPAEDAGFEMGSVPQDPPSEPDQGHGPLPLQPSSPDPGPAGTDPSNQAATHRAGGTFLPASCALQLSRLTSDLAGGTVQDRSTGDLLSLFLDPLGPTLLEISVQDPACRAFYDASILLEVLTDHFATTAHENQQGPVATKSPPALRPTLLLADRLELSQHQRHSLELAELLPHSRPDPQDAANDWLDNDLEPVLHDVKVPLTLRTAFLNIRLWHQAQCPQPSLLEVFTDGSASSDAADIAPCAWALSVWAHCKDGPMLIGQAASQAMPPETPFHVGEQDDSAQTAEYLGIIWGLAWVAEFGFQYRVPHWSWMCHLWGGQSAHGRLGDLQLTRGTSAYRPGWPQSVDIPCTPPASYTKAGVAAEVGLGITGRKLALKRALAQHSPLLVGIQETRLQGDNRQPNADYIILQSSATPAGTGGCALWIAKHVPYASSNRERLYITEADVTVVALGPRHFVATIMTRSLSLAVMVMHVPSLAKAPYSEVKDFWQQRASDLDQRPQGAEYIVLADTNSRVGGVVSDHIGPLDEEPENPAGCTAAFLARGSSQGDIEVLQARTDHIPVLLTCSFARNAPAANFYVSRKRTIRPDTALYHTPEAAGVIQQVPTFAWQVDVDPHYEGLSTCLLQAAESLDTVQQTAPVQQYLRPATLELVDLRGALRKYIKAENAERERRLCMIGFVAFRLHRQGSGFSAQATNTAGRWLSDIDHSIARAVALLQWYGRQLRRAVAADRRAYLQSLTAAAAYHDLADPKSLYQAIRKAFPQAQSSRRRESRVLEDAIAAQEAGEMVTHQEYTRKLEIMHARCRPPAFDLSAIPTLTQAEQTILRLRNGKAAGPDGLTAEVYRLHPPTTARRLAPLLLKVSLRIQEPVGWR